MDSQSAFRKSQKIWISLFLVGNLLDGITTAIGLSNPALTTVELSPVVHYIGWSGTIAIRILWIIAFIWIVCRIWESKPGYAKISTAFLATFLILISFFNTFQGANSELANSVFCGVADTKYMQEILQDQLSISEIEQFMSVCA